MSVSQYLVMSSSIQVHNMTLLLKHFTTITLPLNGYFISIKKTPIIMCQEHIIQNMDQEIKKKCRGPSNKRRKSKEKTTFSIRTAMEKQPNILCGIMQLY
jgi:hypothetical protein